MGRKGLLGLLGLAAVLVLSGCVVRSYPLVKDRVDQDLTSGNRGYLKGQSPADTGDRKMSRTTQVVEIELRSPLRFEKKQKPCPAPAAVQSEDAMMEGNQGFISSSETSQPQVNAQEYTVQKNDTLQKISKKFYGTTKKWMKLYEFNKNVLKGPDKVYPGQVIMIPLEGAQQQPENLK